MIRDRFKRVVHPLPQTPKGVCGTTDEIGREDLHELGSERRETVRSLSVVGVGSLRAPDSSTRGPSWTDR